MEKQNSRKSYNGSLHRLDDSYEESTTSSDSDKFSSRLAFWVTIVGASVGFGNLWRFPYLVYSYGGAAFFIPYLFNLLIVVCPLVILEFGLGQISRSGIVVATNAVHRRGRGAGAAFLACMNVTTYYPLLLSWLVIYLGNAFKREAPWVATDAEREWCDQAMGEFDCLSGVACSWNDEQQLCKAEIVNKAVYFFQDKCNFNPDPQGSISRFSWQILLSNFMCITATFLAVFKGARVIGYVGMVATIGPTILLIALTIVSSLLSGAGSGVKLYIANFDWSVLSSDVWHVALGQALFSIGSGQGGGAAFASHNKVTQNFYADTFVVVIADTIYALVSGFCVFAVAGFLSMDSAVPVADLPLSGSALFYQTFPVAFSTLGYPWGQILNVTFFVTVWLLGWVSMVAQYEAVIVPMLQFRWLKAARWTRNEIALSLSLFYFITNLIYCTDMAMHLMDCIDYFNANFTTIYFATALSFCAGWLSNCTKMMEKCGKVPWLLHCVTWIMGASLGSIVGFFTDNGKIAGPLTAVGVMGSGFSIAVLLTPKVDSDGTARSFGARVYDLTLGGVEDLRSLFNKYACTGCCRVPIVWSILIKYCIPCVTQFFLFLGLQGSFQMPSPDYSWRTWIYVLGTFLPFFVVAFSICGFLYPKWMDFMLPLETDQVLFDFEELNVRPLVRKSSATFAIVEIAESVSARSSEV